MQTKATIMSKSPLLSLEWATKPDRLVGKRLHLTNMQFLKTVYIKHIIKIN